MTLSEIYNEVARRTDTDPGTSINVAETKRVLAKMFDVLSEMDAEEALCFLHCGLRAAAKRTK